MLYKLPENTEAVSQRGHKKLANHGMCVDSSV